MQLSINYNPNEGQRAFHESPAPYKAMVGALGSGKTSTLCVEALALLVENPGNVGLICRRTLPELKMTTMKRFFEYCPKPMIISWNKTERELYIQTSDPKRPSLLYFGPLDDISRYKSLELGFFGLDEADETDRDHWLTLCGRLRLKGIPLKGMVATNPTSPQHWIHDLWVKEKGPDYELFRSKTSDNMANLPPGYIERLRRSFSDDWARRFLDGEFGVLQSGDPCFPDFTQKHHIKTLNPLNQRDMIRGWDFGKRRPFCCFAQFDDYGRFRIYRHVLGDNEDIYQFRDRIIKMSNQFYNTFNFIDYADPSGAIEKDSGKSSIKVLNERGIYPKYRRTTPSQRAVEMRRMMREFKEGEASFLVDPINQYLIEGFMGGYSIDDNGEPKKDGYYEHGMDGVGYIIANTCMMENKVQQSKVEIFEPKWSFGGRYAR